MKGRTQKRKQHNPRRQPTPLASAAPTAPAETAVSLQVKALLSKPRVRVTYLDGLLSGLKGGHR